MCCCSDDLGLPSRAAGFKQISYQKSRPNRPARRKQAKIWWAKRALCVVVVVILRECRCLLVLTLNYALWLLLKGVEH